MSAGTGDHALQFRVMRLNKPSLYAQPNSKFDLSQDMGQPEGVPTRLPPLPDGLVTNTAFAGRVQDDGSRSATSMDGVLLLPQSFGTLHLGEKFVAYVSVSNTTDRPVTGVTIKAELQTDRHVVTLYDNSKAPLSFFPPGQQHDFIVVHDVKQLGVHSLICSSVYTMKDSERRYQPQQYKFSAVNPLAVKTKTRAVRDTTFLEVWLENPTQTAHVMEDVIFHPLPHLSVRRLDPQPAPVEDAGPLRAYIEKLEIIQPAGTRSYVFELTPKPDADRGRGAGTGLGKLEMRWRSPFGEVGKLQTQQISAAASATSASLRTKQVSIEVTSVPSKIVAQQAFVVGLRIKNHASTNSPLLHVSFQAPAALKEGGELEPVLMEGPQVYHIGALPPNGWEELSVTLVGVAPGVHSLAGLGVWNRSDGGVVDMVEGHDIMVEYEA